MTSKKSILAVAMIAFVGTGFLVNNAFAKEKTFQNNKNKGQNYGFEKMMEAKANILNIDKSLLIEKIKNGATFPDILKEKGLSIEWFSQQMREIKTNEIDQLLKEGKIDQARANAMKERIENKKRDCNGESMPRHSFGQGMGRGRNKSK